MKEREHTFLEKITGLGKGCRWIARLLCICLVMASLPNACYSFLVLAAEGENSIQYEVLSFSELPEEIHIQKVNVGTSLEELTLPDTLTVSCLSYAERGKEEMLEGAETTEAVVFGSDVILPESEGEDKEDAGAENEGIETVSDFTIGSITWTSTPDYDSNIEGTYIFTPVLPESYKLAEGVLLPEVLVTVEAEEEGDIIEEEQQGEEPSGEDVEEEPEEEDSEAEPEEIEIPVIMGDQVNEKNDSTQEPEKKEKDQGKLYYGDVDEIMAISEDSEEEPELGRIKAGTSETWSDARELGDGTLIVEEGATLTIMDVVTITGNVTIKGGGKILKESKIACFHVSSSASLILCGITVDGNSVSSTRRDYSMITVYGGTVTLDDGCMLTNCLNADRGGAIYMNSGTVEINDTTIMNCTASSTYDGSGGAIYMASGAVEINDTMIMNCTAKDVGGAIYMASGAIEINDTIIMNCTASNGGAINAKSGTVEINGTMIKDCTANSGGAIIAGPGTTEINDTTITDCEGQCGGAISTSSSNSVVEINNATITDCKGGCGGAFFIRPTDIVNIYSGTYCNNSTSSALAWSLEDAESGGCIYNIGILNIYGGSFIGNKAHNMGGCIYQSTSSGSSWYSSTNLYGGIFEGNTCENPSYKGSGAVCFTSILTNSIYRGWNKDLVLSGNVEFLGDGTKDSGVDGIYLDYQNDLPRKILINSTLTNPVTVFAKASEGYVIAEGKDYVLTEKDRKRFTVFDVSDSDETWYTILDKDNNQIKLARTNPGNDKLFVYYIGVNGQVTDDTEYHAGDDVTVKSGDGLSQDGRVFLGWDTREDGTGTRYHGGEVIENIQDDLNLYAIFGKTLTAIFHSGNPMQEETRTVDVVEGASGGIVKAPGLKDMNGWEKEGWTSQSSGYDVEYQAGKEITITEDRSFYGIYQKDVTLTYDANRDDGMQETNTKSRYANVHEETTYKPAEFHIAPGIAREGYTFVKWNTSPDGSGVTYQEGDVLEREEDLILYAIYSKNSTENSAPYHIEYYLQNLEDDGYTSYIREEEGTIGAKVFAEPESIEGFYENTVHQLRVPSGEVQADGSLVLKLYYDRNIYHMNFYLNYGDNQDPYAVQTLRYGSLIEEITPVRNGYSLTGWYKDEEGTQEWNFSNPVQGITAEILKEQSASLYAQWEDRTAPILGEPTYNNAYLGIRSWIIRKKDLIITVPIIEEGSGIDKLQYTMTPANGEAVSGETEDSETVDNGTIRGEVRLDTENGQTVARVTISDDYEGRVSLLCFDKAGNSAGKTIAAEGGIIVEDNAPTVSLIVHDETDGKRIVDVSVSDTAPSEVTESGRKASDLSENDTYLTGGIKNIAYQIDDNASQNVDSSDYKTSDYASAEKDGMLLSCEFSVDVSGAGKHKLQITAIDNAGNQTQQSVTVNISGQKPGDEQEPDDGQEPNDGQEPDEGKTNSDTTKTDTEAVKNKEPKTSDTSVHIEIYATVAMIAGMFYILLYFCTGKNGMTEEEKNKFVSRILAWAKRGSRIRKPIAIALVFGVLFYYHSIGKRVEAEWNEAYGK